MLEHFCGHCGTLPRAKGPYLIIMDPRMDPRMDSAWLIPGDPLSGLPNRSVFRGKGPHADLCREKQTYLVTLIEGPLELAMQNPFWGPFWGP